MTDTAQVRLDIAAALEGIPDVYPQPLPPRTVQPGSAWPMWLGADIETSCRDVDDFAVMVAVPTADPWAAIEWADKVRDEIRAALLGMAAITRIEPAQVVIGDNGEAIDVLRFLITV